MVLKAVACQKAARKSLAAFEFIVCLRQFWQICKDAMWPRKEYPYIEHTRGLLRMAKGFRIFRLFRFVFFNISISCMTSAFHSETQPQFQAVTLGAARSLVSPSWYRSIKPCQSSNGQRWQGFNMFQPLKDKVRMLRLSGNNFDTHCDKESPKTKDQNCPVVRRRWPNQTPVAWLSLKLEQKRQSIIVLYINVYYIHVFLFLVECYLWLPAVDQMLCGFNGSEKPLQ